MSIEKTRFRRRALAVLFIVAVFGRRRLVEEGSTEKVRCSDDALDAS